MTYITRREDALDYTALFRRRQLSMAIFCTAAHWNTEAILLAGQRIAERHHLAQVPLAVAMTFNYPYMPQAQRITYSRDAKAGFLSNIHHLRALCEGSDSPYAKVVVLPHLDHADPQRDQWALTGALPHLASVMFDAQKYPLAQNQAWTQQYMQSYGDQVLVEGIIEELSVQGRKDAVQHDDYVSRAKQFMEATGVDLLVADLGTEQQSDHSGGIVYQQARARALTHALGDARLVLHGTSSLTPAQMTGLGQDGVIRVNMWTRIVREAGQVAASRLLSRADKIAQGDFEATESRQYLDDSLEAAAEVMVGVMETLGYAQLAL
jgi:fructose/tagatose bisphosphate aldolase